MQPAVWKNTMNDDFVPVRNFTELQPELQQKKLKQGESFHAIEDFDRKKKVVVVRKRKPDKTDDEKKVGRLYEDNENKYCPSIGRYVQIKSFDQEKKIYKCRLIKAEAVEG